MKASFTARVDKRNRISVPSTVIDALSIEPGDFLVLEVVSVIKKDGGVSYGGEGPGEKD